MPALGIKGSPQDVVNQHIKEAFKKVDMARVIHQMIKTSEVQVPILNYRGPSIELKDVSDAPEEPSSVS